MCDQDHFDDDRKFFEERGLVTRRQFGVLLGAGVAMMLPKVANAVTVTESEVNVKTTDGTADCYFVHPSTGTAPAVLVWPDIFGLRPAFRQMGKRLAESGYSVLVVNPFYRVKKAPTAEQGAATPIHEVIPLAQALTEQAQHERREGVHRVARPAAVGGEEPEDRHAGLLHGRTARVPYGGCSAGSGRRRGVVPRRQSGDEGQPEQSASAWPRKRRRSSSSRSPNTDDMRSPTDKTVMKETFAAAKVPAEIEVYSGAAHGWCPPDSGVYNEPQAEKAWSRLLALYGKALA